MWRLRSPGAPLFRLISSSGTLHRLHSGEDIGVQTIEVGTALSLLMYELLPDFRASLIIVEFVFEPLPSRRSGCKTATAIIRLGSNSLLPRAPKRRSGVKVGNRLQLRGLSGSGDEFHLATTVQNSGRTPAWLIPKGQSAATAVFTRRARAARTPLW